MKDSKEEVIQPRSRRLVIYAPSGVSLEGFELDLTGVPNANAQAPMYALIEEQCDLLRWHKVGRAELPCWGP